MKYLLASLSSVAQVTESGIFKVQTLRYGADGIYVGFSPGLSACNGGDQYRMHAKVPYTQTTNSNALISVLLTAYTAGQTFQFIWVSNEGPVCSGSHILNLDMIELTYK